MFELESVLANVELDLEDIPAQVTIAERKVLKHLASQLPGDTAVIDLGAGAGSSSRALAEGLALRERPFPPMHCYDWFAVGPGHQATSKFKAISDASDDSFEEDFRYFLAPYIDHIAVHAGDILKERWTQGPIALLHVDLCKNLKIFDHIAAEFFPHLRPGSILVHQDFSQPRLPWLHYSAGIMADILQPFARAGGSVYYRVEETPSPTLLREVTDKNMPIAKRRAAAARGIENARPLPNVGGGHFICLAEFTDIFIDYWFTDRDLAKQRVADSPSRRDFERLYAPVLKMMYE